MTEVALDTATPHAPSVIRLLLDKVGVAYREVAEHPHLPATSRVQAVLLDDEVGALMVLFPQSQLLDLNRLAELTGRKLTAVSVPRLKQMLDKHQLKALPGIPALTSSPCQYEKSLLDAETVYIQSGETGLLLEIERAHFKRMLAKASASSFGQEIEAISPNLDRPDDDTREITNAVQAFTARRIQKRLEETIEIPPLADTAQKIIKLRVDPNASIDDITGVVETDPALAAQVVSWAASPYYASPGKIRSVEDAIVRVLGFDLVINLALGLALGKTLSLPKDHPQQATVLAAVDLHRRNHRRPDPCHAEGRTPRGRANLPGRAAAQLRLPATGARVPTALLADLPPSGGEPAPEPHLRGTAPAGHQPRTDRRLADEVVGHAGRTVDRAAFPARPGL